MLGLQQGSSIQPVMDQRKLDLRTSTWLARRSRLVGAARGALSRGDVASTQRIAASLIQENPRDAEGYFLLGIALSATGKVAVGIQHIERAVAVDPRGEYLAQLAKLYKMARRDGDAAATLRAAKQAAPKDPVSQDTIGWVHTRLGDHAAALPHYIEAVRLAPGASAHRYNLAVTLNVLGRTDEADAALEELLSGSPGDARAYHLLAGLRKQTPERNHVERIARTLAETPNAEGRLLLSYALAKELEDIGRPQEALERLCSANADHRRTLSYSFDQDAVVFDAIEANWPKLAQASVADPPAEAPIFIIGMPRTGTTLVDRILSSHPEVESAGELQDMPLAVKKAAGTGSGTVMEPETFGAGASGDIGAIGRHYLQRASHHRSGLKPRFTDKFPGNFFFAGFIARALPSARIICLRRHPLDTVLNNFRNLFAVNSTYYAYSYDLLDIAAYYIRFDRLVRLWREAFPERLIEVRYEDLIADQAGETARMLAHCGLDWSDDCLAFHTSSAPVATPSAAQVRRPIYGDSVARWKLHPEVLGPARRLLEQSGIVCD